MDFDFTPAEEAFRQELRTWLAANRLDGYDPDVFEQFDFPTRFAIQRNWQRKLAAAGWVGVGWPKEYGGRGATMSEQAIYHQELGRVTVPGMANEVALTVVGPAMLHHGTEEQKKRYLAKMLNAEEIWCQGYSERGAGSDFAAVQTEAVEDGDYFVVNGHKIWTTFATIADYCLLIVRTDPDVPKHKGLSALLVDMQTPGITVKPLVQMNGDPEFAEVLFKHVRVPKTNLLGEKNHGWEVSMTSLAYERAARSYAFKLEQTLRQLAEVAKQVQFHGRPAAEDATVRQKLAQFHIETQAIRLGEMRLLTRVLRGETPGAETSISKLVSSELNQRIAHFAMELLGSYSQCAQGDPLSVSGGFWTQLTLTSRYHTISSGTSEVQRNILGERVLGLPKG